MSEIPPHLIAENDQDRAELRALVESARQHTEAMACEYPGTCVGGWVLDATREMTAEQMANLLFLAIAELSVLGYGLPLYPTDAALAALDRPEGGDDDDRR